MTEVTKGLTYHAAREQAFSILEVGDATQAFALATQVEGAAERACLMADVAYASGSTDLLRDAIVALSPESHRGEGSVRGRLFIASFLAGDAAKANSVSSQHGPGILTSSCIGILKMLGVDEVRERDVYERVAAAAQEQVLGRANALVPALRLVHASRVLAFARIDAGNDVSQWDAALTENCDRFWGKYMNVLVRNIQGSLWAYTKNPNEPLPRMLPYQVVSLAEVLHRAQALPFKLRREVTRALGRQTKVLTPVWRSKYAEWAPFSAIVRESLEP